MDAGLSVWALSKRETEYHNLCGLFAVSLLILQNIATTYGLQHLGLMYVTYITEQSGVVVKCKIAQDGKGRQRDFPKTKAWYADREDPAH